MNGLDLFSGYGGISRALSPWVRTIAYCENHPFRQLVLLQEMQAGRLDVAPIWDDVRTLRKIHFIEGVDIITGGWPCQGHSVAGVQKGLDDERSGLAKELVRLICELRPSFVFLENVPGVFVSGFGDVTAKLSLAGYVGRYGVLSCIDVDPNAWHERERCWIALADPDSLGHWESLEQVFESEREGPTITRSNGEKGFITYTHGNRREEFGQLHSKRRNGRSQTIEACAIRTATDSACVGRSERREWTQRGIATPDRNGKIGVVTNPNGARLQGWIEPSEVWPLLPFVTTAPSSPWPEGIPEPTLCGKDDGPAVWSNAIETLGGGVVPQVAKEAFTRLFGIKGVKQ